MRKQLDIGNRKIAIGDTCLITKKGSAHGFGPPNVVISIWGFKEADETLVGLYSEIRNKGWADLDGNVPPGHGLWVTPSNLMANVFLMSTEYEISKFEFKNIVLDSLYCKVLHKCNDGNVFVEVDKNIGGGSCDGLGKAGHCILLPTSVLKKVRNRSENKIKTTNKNVW